MPKCLAAYITWKNTYFMVAPYSCKSYKKRVFKAPQILDDLLVLWWPWKPYLNVDDA
jgi:hypothetical protein